MEYVSLDAAGYSVSTTTFGLTGYAERIPRYSGPIGFQPVLEKASWWAVFGGPGTVSSGATDIDGLYFRFEGVAMTADRAGAKVEFTRVDADDESLENTTLAFSLLVDYARGGRIGLRFEENDFDLAFLGSTNIRYGLDWQHIWSGRGAGVHSSMRYSFTRDELDVAGAREPNDIHDVRFTIYPQSQFGFALVGQFEEGDRTDGGGNSQDANAWGLGLFIDMEQVGIAAEYLSRNLEDPDLEDQEIISAKIELRF
jgi:hypothetical protein